MRDLNRADPLPELGPRVEPTPPPAPAPIKRPDGFVVGPDGKLSTALPDPTVNTWCCGVIHTSTCSQTAPCQTQPAPVAAPIPADAPPWPFPQGAMWRSRTSPECFYRWHEGRAQGWSCGRWFDFVTPFERRCFDNLPGFEPLPREPLKVGDKVRLTCERIWSREEMGRTYTVTAIGEGKHAGQVYLDGKFARAKSEPGVLSSGNEGETWERA